MPNSYSLEKTGKIANSILDVDSIKKINLQQKVLEDLFQILTRHWLEAKFTQIFRVSTLYIIYKCYRISHVIYQQQNLEFLDYKSTFPVAV